MNILHINTLDNIGGAAKVAYRLKDNLKERGAPFMDSCRI